jgi:diguanylate cyclase
MNLRLSPRLVNFVLGAPGHLRVRVSQTLLSVLVFTVFAGVLHGQVTAGMIPLARANALIAFNLSSSFIFYLLIRSGLSLRMSSDPALTLPQCLFAMVSITWSYAITGPARGAVMMILLLVIFFGMFALSPRQARGLGAFSLGLLAAVMAWRVRTEPLVHDVRVEVVHFVYATVVIIAVSVLSIRLGKLRNRLSRQKKELQEALERIQTLATRDALTGLLNRRAMLEALAHEAQRTQRSGEPLCLALLDLDHFKHINDTHGHAAGDRVLCRFAEIAREELRATDVLSRWGGEEFMLLLPATGMPAALVCIERVRIRLAATRFDDIAPGLTATFSAGFAQYHGEAGLEHAIERADQAMYRAKAEGRNRTLCLDPGAMPADAGAADRVTVLP